MWSRVLPDEMYAKRDSLNLPVVVKCVHPQILHKTDAGGIGRDLAEELDSVLEEFAFRFPGEPLLVEEQVRYLPPEMIIGGLEDPLLGPAVVVGAGGILTELYQDVSSRLCPCTPLEARRMIRELRLAPLFHGFRNLGFTEDSFAELIVAVAELLSAGEGILNQMDLNPVVFTPEGWIVLDAKTVLTGK